MLFRGRGSVNYSSTAVQLCSVNRLGLGLGSPLPPSRRRSVSVMSTCVFYIMPVPCDVCNHATSMTDMASRIAFLSISNVQSGWFFHPDAPYFFNCWPTCSDMKSEQRFFFVGCRKPRLPVRTIWRLKLQVLLMTWRRRPRQTKRSPSPKLPPARWESQS